MVLTQTTPHTHNAWRTARGSTAREHQGPPFVDTRTTIMAGLCSLATVVMTNVANEDKGIGEREGGAITAV